MFRIGQRVRCICTCGGESGDGGLTDMNKYLTLNATYEIEWAGTFDPKDGRRPYSALRLKGVAREMPFHDGRFELTH